MRKTKKCTATTIENTYGVGLVVRTCLLSRDHGPDVPHHDDRGNWTQPAEAGA